MVDNMASDDLTTMLYWLVGLVLIIFIFDWCWLKPYQEYMETDRIIEKLRQRHDLFYRTLPKYTLDKGIITIINNASMLCGSILILSLRRNLCRLPILVYYIGDELSERNQKFLEAIPGVTTKLLQKEAVTSQARAYALIHSPFQQVLLVEPDFLFCRNPDYLFDDPMYTHTGALFWKDRMINCYWDKKTYEWVKRLIPYSKNDNRILNKKAGNHQSADILLFHKGKHLRTLEKLWILTQHSDTVHSYTDGDKETYWMAAELAKEDYSFVPSYPGAIGECQFDTVYGHTLHVDSSNQLLGWNGCLFNGTDTNRITDFTHYALFDDSAEWQFGKRLKGINNELSSEFKALINEYVKILHDIKNHLGTIDN